MALRSIVSSAGMRAVALAVAWAALVPAGAAAQVPAQYFRQNCAACHTIGGGRLTGPDLKEVTRRRDRSWLIRFIVNPKAVIDSGDPYARQLVQDARGVLMPALPGLTPDLAAALLDLIDAESSLGKSAFVGVQISDRPFTRADVDRGHDLFTGEARQASGGPPCLSCHSVGGVGRLGGGKLGPDLTLVYERLQGRRGLGTWLSAPATPTMQTVFRDTPLAQEELEPLLAFFEDSARRRAEADAVAPLTFFLIGLGGAVFAVVVFDFAWLWRFRGVRRPLVASATSKGTR
ncbi:MAG: cytochrome c [Acidobacteriota bacterium]